MQSFTIHYVVQTTYGQGFVHRVMHACDHYGLMRKTFRLRYMKHPPVYVWVTKV